jgi:hypothetical protein
MTEFSARKLGEVLAFSQVGAETMEKGRGALESVFGADKVGAFIASHQAHAEGITKAAADAGMSEVTLTKAQGTGGKLRSMRDMYVGDEWDNPAELMEWLGFFEGAAVVHFSLVSGSGNALGSDEIKNIASQGMQFHNDILQQVIKAIADYAQKKESAPAA